MFNPFKLFKLLKRKRACYLRYQFETPDGIRIIYQKFDSASEMWETQERMAAAGYRSEPVDSGWFG